MKRKRITRKADSSQIPKDCINARDILLPYAAKCIPETTACAAEGLDYEVWNNWCCRFPALRQEYKRAGAQKLIEYQERVEAGGQGWQASAVLLERLDGGNWSRSASNTGSKPKTSTLARSVQGRKK
jgi:hypothetical protein